MSNLIQRKDVKDRFFIVEEVASPSGLFLSGKVKANEIIYEWFMPLSAEIRQKRYQDIVTQGVNFIPWENYGIKVPSYLKPEEGGYNNGVGLGIITKNPGEKVESFVRYGTIGEEPVAAKPVSTKPEQNNMAKVGILAAVSVGAYLFLKDE